MTNKLLITLICAEMLILLFAEPIKRSYLPQERQQSKIRYKLPVKGNTQSLPPQSRVNSGIITAYYYPKITPTKKSTSISRMANAIKWVESNNRHWVTGKSGERGIAQISRTVWYQTTKRLRLDWSFDYAYNKRCSNRILNAHLEWLIKHCKGNTQTAIRAYNVGLRGAVRYNRGWEYLRKVLKKL